MFSIYPSIQPIVLHLKYFDIYWYGLINTIMLIFTSYYILINNTYCPEIKSKNRKMQITFSVLCIIIGSKLGFVLIYQPRILLLDISLIYKIWLPGRSFYGSLAMFFIGFLALFKKNNEKSFFLCHKNLLALSVSIFFGRIANFFNGEIVGRITRQEPGILFTHIDNNIRHMSQLYEAFMEGIFLFFFIICLRIYLKCSIRFICYFFILYSIIRLYLEYFREVDPFIINYILKYRFTLSQILSIITFCISITIINLYKNYETILKFIKKYNE